MALFHYFLWQTCFPLCVCVCVCVCIYIYTTSSLSIHLSMDIHSPFHVLPVVNSTGVSTGVHVFSQIMVFSGYVPSSGIAGSCDSSLLRTVHTVLHSGCTNSHSHQRCRRACFLHTLSASSLSRVWLCNPMGCSPPGSSVHEDSPGKSSGVGRHAIPQGILQTQELHPGLPHCRQILYQLSHQGSPHTLPSIYYL